MAEQPNVILSSNPEIINLSFGKNMVSLYDTATTQPKFGLQIYNYENDALISDVRQYANLAGYAHFDMQNILKNYTTPSTDIENTSLLKTSPDETLRYYVKYGYENPSNGLFVNQGTYSGDTGLLVIGGRKRYDDLTWELQNDYKFRAGQFFGCIASINKRQKALTDYHISKPLSSLTGGVPTWVSNIFSNVYQQYRRRDDDYTLSFLNVFEAIPLNTLPTGSEGIKAFRISVYNGDTLLDDAFVDNLVANGGGPGTSLSESVSYEYPYDVITIQNGAAYTDTWTNATHFYIATYTYAAPACNPVSTNYSTTPTSQVYRVDLVDDECNDFTPVQVSWLNSFGFRDYFYFSKRTDNTINVKRNTYEQVEGSWSSNIYEVNPYDRGERIFSQEITEEWTINTRYLTDDEAQYLKNLYQAADVRVKFNDEWLPVIITDSSWTERTFRKDKLFQYTLNFRMAHKLNSQRG